MPNRATSARLSTPALGLVLLSLVFLLVGPAWASEPAEAEAAEWAWSTFAEQMAVETFEVAADTFSPNLAVEVAEPEVALGPATRAMRGRVVSVEGGVLRLDVAGMEMLVRPPLGLSVLAGTRVEVAGPVPLGEVFEAETLRVLGP